jgi:hypothetical protein
VFESGENMFKNQPYYFYFEGTITDIRLLRINGKDLSWTDKVEYSDLNSFIGYFKGFVLDYCRNKAEIRSSIEGLKDFTRN